MKLRKERMFDTIQTYKKAGEALDFLLKVGPSLEDSSEAPTQERQGRRRVRQAA
jgi:hypothetical protein